MKLIDMGREQLERVAKKYNIDDIIIESKDNAALRVAIRQAKAMSLENQQPIQENIEVPKSKDENIISFIKSLVAIETAIEPYKEQRKDLRKEYDENNWLNKQEQKIAIKAYRLIKNDEDMDMLQQYYRNIKLKTGV